MLSSAVHELRTTLAGRFPDAVPLPHRTAWSVEFGLSAVDALIPGGGLPRGRLSTALGPGMTALLRAAALHTAARGERVAWVDAAGLASAECDWSGIALIRPAGAVEARVAAEELLRSGGFALVVLAGAPSAALERVRMARDASAGGAAYVELGADDVPRPGDRRPLAPLRPARAAGVGSRADSRTCPHSRVGPGNDPRAAAGAS